MIRLYSKCADICNDLNDSAGLSWSLLIVANAKFLAGELPQSLTTTNKSLEAASKLDSSSAERALLEAEAQNVLGVIRYRQGDLSGALQCYEQSRALFEAKLSSDAIGQAGVLNNTGLALTDRGELAEALKQYDKARQLQEAAGDSVHLAVLCAGNRNLLLCLSTGDQIGLCSTLNNIAIIYFRR